MHDALDRQVGLAIFDQVLLHLEQTNKGRGDVGRWWVDGRLVDDAKELVERIAEGGPSDGAYSSQLLLGLGDLQARRTYRDFGWRGEKESRQVARKTCDASVTWIKGMEGIKGRNKPRTEF